MHIQIILLAKRDGEESETMLESSFTVPEIGQYIQGTRNGCSMTAGRLWLKYVQERELEETLPVKKNNG